MKETITGIVGKTLGVDPKELKAIYTNVSLVVGDAHDKASDDDENCPTQYHVIAEMIKAAHDECPNVPAETIGAICLVFYASGSVDEKQRNAINLLRAIRDV